jgi:hypothetical protein
MTDHELDARFEEAAKLLTSAAWEREPLFTLAHAVAEAQHSNAPHVDELRALRDHIRGRAGEIRDELDRLLSEVPCTIHARILFVELLTGYPGLPGGDFDLTKRAHDLVKAIQGHLYHPWEEKRQQYDQRLNTEGLASAHKYEYDVRRWDNLRLTAAERDLTVEALRIFQQLHEAGEQWMKRPRTGSTFAHQFSLEQWTQVQDAMVAVGVKPMRGKGKNNLVAALHAAFKRFEKPIPAAGQWIELMRNTYPSVTWNEKSVPEERAAHMKKGYALAYRATLDRLQ